MSDVICRRATSEDFEGVMAINDSDYLLPMYHRYLKDPQSYCYVCLKHREIVSLFNQLVHTLIYFLPKEKSTHYHNLVGLVDTADLSVF